MIYQGEAFNGKPTKTARSHGKKFQVTVEKETSRILVRFNNHLSDLLVLIFIEFVWNLCVTGKLGMGLYAAKGLYGG